jgi:hypothetical protein
MIAAVDTSQLIVYTETGTSYLQLSERSIWTFGRSKSNTVQLDDPWASRYHAQLEVLGGQFYYFVDLQSRNGSLINNQLVIEPVLLKNGDHISIGQTKLIFEHNVGALGDQQSDQPVPEVLMLHDIPFQEEFWQEVLHFQNIEVLSVSSGTEFTHQIDLYAAANTLPKVLLIDVRAYQGNPYYFCRWCRRKYPQVLIFLIDSLRQDVSKFEYQVAVKNGAIKLFPAIHMNDIHLNISKILLQVNAVLTALDKKNIGETVLFSFHRLLSNRSVQNASMTLVNLTTEHTL